MDQYTNKAKAINKLEGYGMEARLRLAATVEKAGVPVTDNGIPSSEELADAIGQIIRRTQEGASPASSEETQKVLDELQSVDLPTVEEDQDEVKEILADLKEMEVPVAE